MVREQFVVARGDACFLNFEQLLILSTRFFMEFSG